MAAISTLVETFNDNSMDSAKWTNWGGAQSVETNRRFEATTTTTATYYGWNSTQTYDLTGSSVFIQLIDAGNQALTSFECYPLQMYLDANNKYEIIVFQNTVRFRRLVAGVTTTIGSDLSYDSAVHKWFRIRESSGTIYGDYSTDGITWTNIGSHSPAAFAITALYLYIFTGCWAVEGSTGTIILDNLNVPVQVDQVTKSFYLRQGFQ
jgi:hypothetical protein